jgi:dTDP-4-dehydrorhamnose 3,5-epimerase
MSNDIILSPLKIIESDLGKVLHGIKHTDTGFTSFQEAYFSTVKYNCIKGWKKHNRMTLNLIVIQGTIKFVIYNPLLSQSSKVSIQKFILNREKYSRLTVPPGYWVSFSGLEERENILLNVSDLLHDPSESENLPIHTLEIPFNWRDE